MLYQCMEYGELPPTFCSVVVCHRPSFPRPNSRVPWDGLEWPGNEARYALSFSVVCGALLAQHFSWWETQQNVTSMLHLKVSVIVN